jgi:hypothetical protein
VNLGGKSIDVRRLHRGITSVLPFVRLLAERTNSKDDNAVVEFLEVVLTLDATDLAPLNFENPDGV